MKKLMKKLRDTLNNERGLTLIELLAVVVILAIIAAIAIPSIGGLMDNTKKDAHIANAEQMISSARLAVTGDQELSTGSHYIPLGYLYKENYLEKIKDPDKGNYVEGATELKIDTTTKKLAEEKTPPTGSYVRVEDGKMTEVKLINEKGKKERGVQKKNGDPIALFDGRTPAEGNTPANEGTAHDLTRKDVN